MDNCRHLFLLRVTSCSCSNELHSLLIEHQGAWVKTKGVPWGPGVNICIWNPKIYFGETSFFNDYFCLITTCESRLAVNILYVHRITLVKGFFFRHSGPIFQRTRVQSDMARMSHYCQKWRLKPSVAKTVASAFHLHNVRAHRKLQVCLDVVSISCMILIQSILA